MSVAITRPLGPVPLISLMSNPALFAIIRAIGEAITRPPLVLVVGIGAGVAVSAEAAGVGEGVDGVGSGSVTDGGPVFPGSSSGI